MTAINTMMRKPAITAYSAAVGPSSSDVHRRIFDATLRILEFLFKFFKNLGFRNDFMLATRHRRRRRGCERADHEMELLTELNVPLTLVPSVFTPAATTAMIKANITPYSTAVGTLR